jgi:hypothetical protein
MVYSAIVIHLHQETDSNFAEERMKHSDSRQYWPVRWFGMREVKVIPRGYDAAMAVLIGTSKDGQYANSRSAACAFKCVRLQQGGHVDHVVLIGGGGGKEPGHVVEAVGAWRTIGCPGGVVLELTSQTTETNALRALEIMRKHGWRRAIICAEAIHAKRVKRDFTRAWAGSGCRFIVVPTYGLYDDAKDWKETSWGFLLFNTMATLGLPVLKRVKWLKRLFLRRFNRLE